MMTLDEAIAHAKELSENKSVCKDCREEHKQLAEWLEELKQNKSKECKANADMRKLKRMVQIKKETDEFVKKLKEQEQ